MIRLVDVNAHDLLHTPPVRERLGPEWIDAVLGRAIRVDSLARHHLRRCDGPSGIRHDAAQACDAG
jgi:hypothetical protein